MPTPADTLIVVLLVLLPVLYYYRETLPLIGKPVKLGDRAGVNGNAGKKQEEEGDPRDWLEQMQKAVSHRRRRRVPRPHPDVILAE